VLLENGRVSEAQQVLALLSVQEMDQFSRRSMLAGVSSGQAQGSIVAAPVGSSAVAPAAPSGPTAKPGAGTRGLMRGDSPQLAELTYSKSEQDLHRVNGEEIEIGQKLEALKQKQDEQGDLSPEDEKELQSLHAKYKSYMESFKDDESQMAKRSNDPHLKDEITGFSTSFQGTLKRVGHGAVAANYYIFDDVVDIILAVPNAPPIVRSYSVKTELLNQKIRDFNRKLSNDSQDPIPLARELYKVLIGPIDDDLEKAKAQTLMLVLHDELRYVPFAALNDGKRYLIERMAVVNVNMTAMDKLNEPQSVAWSAYGLGITKKGKTKTGREYEALTYAGKELSDVKNTLGGNSQIHTDEEFTEDMFQKGLQGKYPVIHIASHFDFEPGDINNSVLVLGDGTTLSLADIQTGFMFTGVELLTLSACETALGDGKAGADGSEVEGLGKIAQDNGAMAVIATLWPVVDESTGIFMSALYKAHQDHLTKAESLQKAQLTLLHGKFAHPRYWAPFILMGNWL
jgi:CHAT domain-containing protein